MDIPFNHSEHDVIEAYRRAIRLKARQVQLESNGMEETTEQFEERLDATADADTLALQYLAQFSY